MRLGIVDDSSIMRKTIEKYLDGYDINVVGTASNGVEAIRLVQNYYPDILTLDITMPEMDGLTSLEEIMKIAPETKVIVITALSDKLTGLQALDKGASGYLFKPVNSENLKKAFDKLILSK